MPSVEQHEEIAMRLLRRDTSGAAEVHAILAVAQALTRVAFALENLGHQMGGK